MDYFYKKLWAQYYPPEYWHRMSSAQEAWRGSIINSLAGQFPIVYVEKSIDIANVSACCEHGVKVESTFAHLSDGQDNDRGVCGLIYLTDPASVLKNVRESCRAIQPDVAILSVLPPCDEKKSVIDLWLEMFSGLRSMEYHVFDPCGDDLCSEDKYLYSSTFYALAVKKSTSFSDLKAITDQYWRALEPDEIRSVVTPDFIHLSAEVVSLKTAALAAGDLYHSEKSSNGIFEINQRKFVSPDSEVELARFSSALVLPNAGWKVFAQNKYYVEEIGPSDWSGLYNISHWRSLDGYWGINDSSPVIERADIPAGSFLLGGDPAYYHWIFNYLPRLKAANLMTHMGCVSDPLPILVSDKIPIRLLEIIPKLLDVPFTMIALSHQAIYRTKDLYVPSFFSGHEACLDVSQFYKSRLGIAGTQGSRKIYISRRDARDSSTPRRKVYNEAEVIDCLSRYGFESLSFGDASVDDQIRIFSEAEFVIGSHGAAFANMVFSPPGAKAIIFENSWNHTFMKDVLIVNQINAETLLCEDVFDENYESQAIGLGESANEVRRSRDMIVDLTALEAMLAEFG